MNRALVALIAKWAIGLLVALICYDRLGGNDVFALITLVIMMRMLSLVREMRKNPKTARPHQEIVAEIAGLAAFIVLVPLDVALATMDFFSLRNSFGWRGGVVIAICFALYAAPHLNRDPRRSILRSFWWIGPFLPALFVLVALLAEKHNYLNPFHPQRSRLAADRVLDLDIVSAGHHADWVLNYAIELDKRNDPEAAHYYRQALRLNATFEIARRRLAVLEPTERDSPSKKVSAADPQAPYWTDVASITKAARFDPKTDDATSPVVQVVVASVGQTPEIVLDAAAYAIQSELSLTARVSVAQINLPTHTRARGLLGNRQWNESTLVRAFFENYRFPRNSLLRYVILTPADLYSGEENYLFSCSYSFGSVVSYARLAEDPENPTSSLTLHRAAKQSIGSLVKSFDILSSPERDCVTSYVRSVPEFDQKGNRPAPATMEQFQNAVTLLNARSTLRKFDLPVPTRSPQGAP